MKIDSFSVLIIVKGRKDHLLNVLDGIQASTRKPAEIVIVHMNEAAYDLPNRDILVRQIEIKDTHALPLAKARNAAAREASTSRLVFLDVDCIPHPDCFATLLDETPPNTVSMVDPQYLIRIVTEYDLATFKRYSQPNPARKNITYGISNTYELFWSLGFAMYAEDFNRMHGFDEQFIGYGGEDTDFAFALQTSAIQLNYSPAIVYHQPHDTYDPPLNWLSDIATNAQIFKQKWGTWPMEGWLRSFENKGYIRWHDDSIEVMHLPNDDEISAARRTNAETLAQ